MKTTVDLPDPLFRKVKASAAEQGMSLKRYITEAMERTVNAPAQDATRGVKPWMKALETVPKIPKAVLREVGERVAEADAEDLAKRKSH